jgi:ribosome biogenesis GTPase A
MANLVIEVLDARDPKPCRSSQLENKINNDSKKLYLVLNKCDLIHE